MPPIQSEKSPNPTFSDFVLLFEIIHQLYIAKFAGSSLASKTWEIHLNFALECYEEALAAMASLSFSWAIGSSPYLVGRCWNSSIILLRPIAGVLVFFLKKKKIPKETSQYEIFGPVIYTHTHTHTLSLINDQNDLILLILFLMIEIRIIDFNVVHFIFLDHTGLTPIN